MAKILILAKSGFGKTTSYAGRKKYGIEGLDPKTTFVIQCIGRGVPNPDFKLAPEPELKYIAQYNRVQVDTINGLDRFRKVAEFIESFKNPKNPYKNLIIDDFNYLAQDFYMANAMRGGWDTPKQIGYGMGLIFDSFKGMPENKNIICCAHYEEYKDKNGDSISYKFKTTGKMVDEYCTPEGKFDMIIFGKQTFDPHSKQSKKVFVKEFDGEYPAKDSLGYLDELPDEFPNDMKIIVSEIARHQNI
jgi:hypothetical protein